MAGTARSHDRGGPFLARGASPNDSGVWDVAGQLTIPPVGMRKPSPRLPNQRFRAPVRFGVQTTNAASASLFLPRPPPCLFRGVKLSGGRGPKLAAGGESRAATPVLDTAVVGA